MKLLIIPVLLALSLLVRADDPPKQIKMLSGPATATGPVLREVWANRTNPQGRLGWMQTISYTVEENGKPYIRTVVRDHMRYLRSGDPYSVEREQYTIEDTDGTVIEVGYRTNMATSYAAGRMAQLIDSKFKFWVYKHGNALEPRLQHLAWDGQALPPEHPF